MGVIFMPKKYSYEVKLKVVEEYLKGKLSYQSLRDKYDISDRSLIINWVESYRNFGKDGLKPKKGKTKYSLDFKLNVLHFKQETGASYRETAREFGLNNPSLIANWRRVYLEGGAQNLEKPIGRPPEVKKKSDQKNTNNKKLKSSVSSEKEELKRLRQEITYLKIENLYLKKLKELGLIDHRDPNRPNSR